MELIVRKAEQMPAPKRSGLDLDDLYYFVQAVEKKGMSGSARASSTAWTK